MKTLHLKNYILFVFTTITTSSALANPCKVYVKKWWGDLERRHIIAMELKDYELTSDPNAPLYLISRPLEEKCTDSRLGKSILCTGKNNLPDGIYKYESVGSIRIFRTSDDTEIRRAHGWVSHEILNEYWFGIKLKTDVSNEAVMVDAIKTLKKCPY